MYVRIGKILKNNNNFFTKSTFIHKKHPVNFFKFKKKTANLKPTKSSLILFKI